MPAKRARRARDAAKCDPLRPDVVPQPDRVRDYPRDRRRLSSEGLVHDLLEARPLLGPPHGLGDLSSALRSMGSEAVVVVSPATTFWMSGASRASDMCRPMVVQDTRKGGAEERRPVPAAVVVTPVARSAISRWSQRPCRVSMVDLPLWRRPPADPPGGGLESRCRAATQSSGPRKSASTRVKASSMGPEDCLGGGSHSSRRVDHSQTAAEDLPPK
jgi:hypothetical protein